MALADETGGKGWETWRTARHVAAVPWSEDRDGKWRVSSRGGRIMMEM